MGKWPSIKRTPQIYTGYINTCTIPSSIPLFLQPCAVHVQPAAQHTARRPFWRGQHTAPGSQQIVSQHCQSFRHPAASSQRAVTVVVVIDVVEDEVPSAV